MGNFNNYEISYADYKSKYDSNDYTIFCNSPDECKQLYTERIIQYIETLYVLNQENAEELLLNTDIVYNESNKAESINKIIINVITTILLQSDIEPSTITEEQFNEAKNLCLTYIKTYIDAAMGSGLPKSNA